MRLDPLPALKGIFKLRENNDPEAVKPFLDHLEDLRWMVLKVAVTLIVGMMASFGFRGRLLEILEQPLLQFSSEQRDLLLQTIGPTDGFTIALQFAFYSGIALTLPVLLFFISQFVLPALTRREKKYLLPAIGVGFILFLAGMFFCFKLVLPRAVGFFFNFNQDMGFRNIWRATDYFSFVTRMELAFGVAAELARQRRRAA